ncbi:MULTISPECIES: carbohydrate ABC transporter permease [Paenibacillus]|uniref:carbohydrate ABC transporter permease n=1 Tax=Paenibacillus TaxID=44249 RepID=UPI00203D364A|nr:carbohydrate ABC transporter permease [Paenibacillus camelliae]MCM3634600.1 carbohydrate ABC transporter permease [Paenibacillus camelliae]
MKKDTVYEVRTYSSTSISKLSKKLLKHVLIVTIGLGMLYPLLWLFSSSFKPNTEIFQSNSFFPQTFTLDNYKQGWSGLSGVTFGKFFANSFFIVAMCIIGNVIACSMAAFAFARLKFALRKMWFAIMLITMMLPFHVTIIPQYIIFNSLELVNTYVPLILPKFLAVESFFIFLIVQFIRSIPGELDEAVKIDGCGPFKLYIYLIMPLALPALVTTTIFTFIWTWNDFFGQLLYISEINLYTVALGLRMFLDAMGQNSWGALFAMSILSLVPLFAIFIFFQRYLIEGIATGGLKG